jgi:NAD(P)H-flavin reductase
MWASKGFGCLISKGSLRSSPTQGTKLLFPSLEGGNFRLSSRRYPTRLFSTSQWRYIGVKDSTETAKSRKTKRIRPWHALFAALTLAGGYLLVDPPQRRKSLNDETFSPYKIITREQVSSTSFILTVQPSDEMSSIEAAELCKRAWNHGLWYVELKQPQLQIAREYTPIPPRYDGLSSSEAASPSSMRFFVRAINGGEMSTYLSRLSVGDVVHVRGPHFNPEIHKLLGLPGCANALFNHHDGTVTTHTDPDSPSKVVFLAGGTGIAPALQTINSLLNDVPTGAKPKITLLWANRKREEVQLPNGDASRGGWLDTFTRPFARNTVKPNTVDETLQGPSLIAQQLVEMRRIHGDCLQIQVLFDEEGFFIGEQHIKQLLGLGSPDTGRFVVRRDEGIPVGSQGDTYNLLLVSGPDGFIDTYAGPKVWRNGRQEQGPVGGVIGRIEARHPEAMNKWAILKL